MAIMKVNGHEYYSKNFRITEKTNKRLELAKKKIDKTWDGVFRALLDTFELKNK